MIYGRIAPDHAYLSGFERDRHRSYCANLPEFRQNPPVGFRTYERPKLYSTSAETCTGTFRASWQTATIKKPYPSVLSCHAPRAGKVFHGHVEIITPCHHDTAVIIMAITSGNSASFLPPKNGAASICTRTFSVTATGSLPSF